MRMIFCEMKKSWFRLPVLMILLLFLLLDFYKLSGVYKMTGFLSGSNAVNIKDAYYTIGNEYLRGEITDEKIGYIRERYSELSEKISSGSFNREYDEGCLTGYEYDDYTLYNFFIVPEMTYAVTYPNISNKITTEANENVQFFLSRNNEEEALKNRYISQLYSGREIKEYYLTGWTEMYFKYDFSSLLILVMIIVGLSPSFSMEQESGMYMLIKAGGRQKEIICAKLISGAVYIFLLTVIFTAFDLWAVGIFCETDGLSAPLYYSEFFKYSPFDFSIFSAVLLCAFVRFLAFLAVGGTAMLVSETVKNSAVSSCAMFGITAALIALSGLGDCIIDPVELLSPYKYLTEFRCVTVFGRPVLTIYCVIAVYVIICALIAALIVVIGIGKEKYHNAEIRTEKAVS